MRTRDGNLSVHRSGFFPKGPGGGAPAEIDCAGSSGNCTQKRVPREEWRRRKAEILSAAGSRTDMSAA
jgi:hypothetical protein